MVDALELHNWPPEHTERCLGALDTAPLRDRQLQQRHCGGPGWTDGDLEAVGQEEDAAALLIVLVVVVDAAIPRDWPLHEAGQRGQRNLLGIRAIEQHEFARVVVTTHRG